MSSKLTLQVATFTTTYTSSLTDAATADLLVWFIVNTADAMPDGLTEAQQNQWKLDAVRDKLVTYIRSEAAANKARAQLIEAQAEIEQQAAQDTAF